MTYVCPNTYTNKQTFPIFNCVTRVSVSLATLTHQLHESECDMVNYFTSRLMYFHEPEVTENKA